MISGNSRIESDTEVKDYIAKIKYALDNGAEINFQEKRQVDENRNIKYTNGYTVRALFPDENPVDALRRELRTLTVQNYLRTVRDISRPNLSEMREFGKVYHGTEEVYIKIRVEMIDLRSFGQHTVFVMSFHYAQTSFSKEVFPYRTIKGGSVK